MTDVDELVRCITALLALNERNVLVPHGVPGLARDCLKSAADALERMRGALLSYTSYPCPACSGDCEGAEPPMLVCPTQLALKALAQRSE